MQWQNEAQTASSGLLPPGLVFSDTPSRAMAYFLDSLVMGVIGSVPLSIAGFYDWAYPNLPDRNAFALAILLSYVLSAVYFVWFWTGGRRATPGQRVFNIQVANAFDGRPLSARQAVTRWLGFGFWLGLPFLLPIMTVAIASIIASMTWSLVVLVSAIASPTKQGVHDRLAGSAVVRPAGAGNRWAVGGLVILLILTALEGLLLASAFMGPSASYLPPDFWDVYLRWLWPS